MVLFLYMINDACHLTRLSCIVIDVVLRIINPQKDHCESERREKRLRRADLRAGGVQL